MDNPASPPPPAKTSTLADTIKTMAWALVLMLALRTVLFEPFTIPSASMEPALLVGDYLVATKFDYGWSRYSLPVAPPLKGRLAGRAPQRGDVVILRLPRDPAVSYVKRLIGLPGDRVQVVAGALRVNGRPVASEPVGRSSIPATEARSWRCARGWRTAAATSPSTGDRDGTATTPASTWSRRAAIS